MSKLFEEMAQGVVEAHAYVKGERKGCKVTLSDSIDMRASRKKLHLSQGKFAATFGLSIDALEVRQPHSRSLRARALLTVIAHNPKLLWKP